MRTPTPRLVLRFFKGQVILKKIASGQNAHQHRQESSVLHVITSWAWCLAVGVCVCGCVCVFMFWTDGPAAMDFTAHYPPNNGVAQCGMKSVFTLCGNHQTFIKRDTLPGSCLDLLVPHDLGLDGHLNSLLLDQHLIVLNPLAGNLPPSVTGLSEKGLDQ